MEDINIMRMIGMNKIGELMVDKRSGKVLYFEVSLKDMKRFEKLNKSRNNEFELRYDEESLKEIERRNKEFTM